MNLFLNDVPAGYQGTGVFSEQKWLWQSLEVYVSVLQASKYTQVSS